MEIQRRRKPAIRKKISEIKVWDEYVGVVGWVLDRKDTEFVLDDGSGRLTVFFEDPGTARGIGAGSRVRVFGVPSKIPGVNELHADIVQDLGEFDMELYDEVRREVKKFERELRGVR